MGADTPPLPGASHPGAQLVKQGGQPPHLLAVPSRLFLKNLHVSQSCWARTEWAGLSTVIVHPRQSSNPA